MKRPKRLRLLAVAMIALGLSPGTWWRMGVPAPDYRETLRLDPVALPTRQELGHQLGPFELEGVWNMTSPHTRFGGWSALLALDKGRFVALSDRGFRLTFAPPGSPALAPQIAPTRPDLADTRHMRDAEAATRDPATGRVWVAWEGTNAITRHGSDFGAWQKTYPPEMRDWGSNSGPESLVRLQDGRFVLLREGFNGWRDDRFHRALLYPGDPLDGARPRAFTFEGPAGYSPTDMAQLPDGRVLILLRKLVWPMPLRYSCKLAIADPATIRPGTVWRAREVAMLASSLPVDNFEGLAVVPLGEDRPGGRIAVWLISDDNSAVTQRTLLWRLAVDPARLPGGRPGAAQADGKKARGSAARPHAPLSSNP